MLQAILAPQASAANTVGQVANSSGAASAANGATRSAGATVDEFGDSVDRLLAGRPTNADELARIRAEVVRRATAARNAAGCAQDDPVRRSPWHPRTPELWPAGDALRLDQAALAPERGMWARFAPPPDGIPAADPPLGLDLNPVRVNPRDQLPTLGPAREPGRRL